MKETQFYIVPTPIGNLKDITLRAIETLKEVDIIACEDSRVTQKLLNHFDIKTKTVSYHKYNEQERVGFFLNLIDEGKKIALVSDAGTPLISDPGSILVKELLKKEVKITSLAGACAITTFLSQIPRIGEDFCFVGFLPKSEKQIKDIIDSNKHTNIVFYESPNRLLKTLKYISNIDSKIKVAVGRELTKMFEEIVVDEVEKVIEHFEKNILKGEIVAMIYKKEEESLDEAKIKTVIEKLKNKNF